MYLAYGAHYIVAPNFNPEGRRAGVTAASGLHPRRSNSHRNIDRRRGRGRDRQNLPTQPRLDSQRNGPHALVALDAQRRRGSEQRQRHALDQSRACALGIGSNLVSKAALANRDFDSIREGTRSMLTWITEVRV